MGTGQAGRRLGRDPSLGLGSLPQPGGGWRLGSEAAGGHFSCGAAESPGGPPRPNTSAVPPSRPHRGPLPAAGPGRAGRERPRRPARLGPGLGAAGRGPARGRLVDGIRAEERAGGKKGEGGEPLPILGRSRRRRRPAVGESKVVAGRHFGIFPQPAGHCGGHGESGPMAGGEVRWGRDAEGGKGRERGAVRSRPRRAVAGAAAAPPPPPASHSLTHSHAPVAAAASSPEPAPTPAPPRSPGSGKGPGRDLGGVHYTHHR